MYLIITSSKHDRPRLRTGHGKIYSSYILPQKGDPWRIPPPPPHPDIMGVGSNARVFVNGKIAATLGTPTVQGGLIVVGSHSVFM